MARAKVKTGNTSKEALGVRSIINVNHEGTLKRPTETTAVSDDTSAKDIGIKPPAVETPFNNPGFLNQGGAGEKKG